jgi:hypothetical protein
METDERWKCLCKRASVERDPEKLVELVREINDLLEARRLQGNSHLFRPPAITSSEQFAESVHHNDSVRND